ncbi:MAG: mechanosensitive ion channel [Myxococcota bacterium]|nr:mechanosensitive ion channel [Myxococcota bacterium]
MSGAFEISTFWTLSLTLGGLLLVGLMRGLRHLAEQLPVSQARRDTLRRILPLFEIIVGLLYVLLSVPIILDHDPETTPIVTAAILLGGVAVLWFAIRDFVHGVLLKSSDMCRVGDHLQVGDISGRLKRLDFRVMAIETARGDEILVPYSQVSRQSIIRTPVPDGQHRHGFAVHSHTEASPSALRDTLFEAAWTHHWSAIATPPIIDPREDGGFDVTVFALDALHTQDIEAAVREAVDDPP